MNALLRWLRVWVPEARDGSNAAQALMKQTACFERTRVLVRVYYVLLLYQIIRAIDSWGRWLEETEIDALWPVAWVPWVGIEPAVHAIHGLVLAATFACALWPERRELRGLVFVAVLEYAAYANSFGKIGHGWHAWLAVSFVLVFLPRLPRAPLVATRSDRQAYLTVYGGAMAMVALFYTMAGFLKVAVGLQQMAAGEVNSFSPTAMAHQIAARLMQTDSHSLFGSFLIEHPLLGWGPYLLTIFLELFALLAVFRPSLHRVWGIGLMAFHAASAVTLGISFSGNVLLLGLLFVCSPFAPSPFSPIAVVRALPGMEWLRLREMRRLKLYES